MNPLDMTLRFIIELFEMFNIDNDDSTLKDIVAFIDDHFEFYDDASDLYYDFIKYELSDRELIDILEEGIENGYNFDDIVDEMLDDYNIKTLKNGGYVRYDG